jgi:hypothetical protein
MILKLEVYVEAQTKEPVVVKQVLTEKLISAITELTKSNSHDGSMIMKVIPPETGNNPDLKRELISTEQFLTLLTNRFQGRVLTMDEVVERMRTN